MSRRCAAGDEERERGSAKDAAKLRVELMGELMGREGGPMVGGVMRTAGGETELGHTQMYE